VYVEALKIKIDKQKEPYFLSRSQETFETLNYKMVKEKLDEYFSPKKNVDYEIFKLHNSQMKQLNNLSCG